VPHFLLVAPADGADRNDNDDKDEDDQLAFVACHDAGEWEVEGVRHDGMGS
jgi:hypothetical protein